LDQPTDFTLRNRSGQVFETNFYSWNLYKRVDNNWYYIMPQTMPMPLATVAPGETHTWTLTITGGRVSDGGIIIAVQGTKSLETDGLGGGHYAFTIDGWFESESYEESIVLGAGFELDADPLQLTPTTTIGEIEWDGETLVARPTHGEERDDADRHDRYVLERIETSDPDAQQVIIEQVIRHDRLRNAIALSRDHDAARVRLEGFSSSIPPFMLDGDRIYEFRGDYYRATITESGAP
jgi:hypothetical protein